MKYVAKTLSGKLLRSNYHRLKIVVNSSIKGWALAESPGESPENAAVSSAGNAKEVAAFWVNP